MRHCGSSILLNARKQFCTSIGTAQQFQLRTRTSSFHCPSYPRFSLKILQLLLLFLKNRQHVSNSFCLPCTCDMMTCETRIHKRVRDCLARHLIIMGLTVDVERTARKAGQSGLAEHRKTQNEEIRRINCDERRHSDTSTLNGECVRASRRPVLKIDDCQRAAPSRGLPTQFERVVLFLE